MTALAWAAVWAFTGMLIGIVTGLLDHPLQNVLDPWVALAMPGFIGGVLFSLVLWMRESRPLQAVPLPRLAMLGAAAGLLLGTLPFILGSPTSGRPLWQMAVQVIGFTVGMGAISALCTGRLFRARTRL